MRWVAWNTASGVEVCMPEFSFVDFLGEDRARIQGCLRADDVDNGLRQCFKQRKERLVVRQVSI